MQSPEEITKEADSLLKGPSRDYVLTSATQTDPSFHAIGAALTMVDPQLCETALKRWMETREAIVTIGNGTAKLKEAADAHQG